MVRICIAVDDIGQTAGALGWDENRDEEQVGDRWSTMEAASKQNCDAFGGDATRFIWVEVEIPLPDSPEEGQIVEIHRARQRAEECQR